MQPDDVKQVVEIDRECFPPDWPSPQYKTDLESNEMAHYLVACDEKGQIDGVIGMWMMANEAHVMTMGVRRARRRQGIGELLLIAAIDLATSMNASSMTLEVRLSNEAAIALYEKYGFIKLGNRLGYYKKEQEDALIMSISPLTSTQFQKQFSLLKQKYIKDHNIVLHEILELRKNKY
jgi:ribosomal-protein-alanine N-acetyltransferase